MLMESFTVLSPLRQWALGSDTQLSGDVWVRRLSGDTAPDFETWRFALGGWQIKSLKHTEFWLRYDFSDEPAKDTERKEQAKQLVQNSGIACQVVAPVGGHPLIVLCSNGAQGLVPLSIVHHSSLESTCWARMSGFAVSSVNDVFLVVEGVQDAMRRKIVRLQNPLYLLEMGLQATNIHIRTLLWVMALDAVVMGGNQASFASRLCNFLGKDSYVFPAIDLLGQPKYRVGDVSSDLYDLRSSIGHGKRIPRRFVQPVGFRDCADQLLAEYKSTYQYRQLLEESALFLLCHTLRKVFAEKLADTVSREKQWRALLLRQHRG